MRCAQQPVHCLCTSQCRPVKDAVHALQVPHLACFTRACMLLFACIAGFKEGALAGFEWGALKAAVKTLELLCGQVPGTAHMQGQVRGALPWHRLLSQERQGL